MLPKAPIIARQRGTLACAHLVDILLLNVPPGDPECLELVSEVRTLCPQVVIIGMTTSATLNSIIDAMRLGASDYLVKPFRVDELSAVLERAAMTFPRSPVCACYAKACTQPWDLDP